MQTTARLGAALVLALAGCGDKDGVLDDLTVTGAGPGGDPGGSPSGSPSGEPEVTGDEPTSGTSGTTGDEPTTGGPPGTNPVDVLFVIDNSGSMADEQALLAANIEALTNTERDIRIAVTTTDSGNPRCAAAMTKPEGGRFVASSCLERVNLGDFQFNMEYYDYACTDICAVDTLTTLPTVTAWDSEPKPHPWFEQLGGMVNVEGLSLTQALQCALPQGVSGCGFEQPLESMYLALAKAQVENEPNYGFLRDEADLVVVFLTDEMDCSYNKAFDEIFVDNKIFWSDPESPATSAVCFNAGVECEGPGPSYPACPAVDKDITGAVTGDPGQAVLQPVSKYIDFLTNLQQSKTGGARVRVVAITGVPPGFESGAPLVLEDDPDQDQQNLFGIGPGCTLPNPDPGLLPATALPPLRLLEVGEGLGPLNFYSICANDYSAAVAAVLEN